MAEDHNEENPGEEGPVPVLRWDLGLFEQFVRSFRFPPEWDVRYPGQNQTVADAPPDISSSYVEPMLQRTIGFFYFANRGAARKILLNPPKSFHDWKPIFFFIREEVLPIAMPFRDWSKPVLREDLPIPKHERWYQQLTPTPNRVFGKNVLVAARMSDRWSPDSEEVPILKIDNQEVRLYQAAFPTFGGFMGVRPLRHGEEYWYEQIRSNFMYPAVGAFAEPPTTTEGAHIPNPRPLRSVTSAQKEIVYLSSEESVGSSNGELSPWSQIFEGVITLDPEVTSKGAGGSRATALAADKGEKRTGAGGSKSSGSAGSRNPDAGTIPSSAAQEGDDEEEAQEEPAAQLIRKRSREAALGATVLPKTGGAPLIGKKSNLRSLYKFSPEAEKKKPEKGITLTEPLEPAQKRPRATLGLKKRA
ncbi:hypothetical protein Hanom_Chr17g01585501 [Helianthus anomalus]